jgi:heptosyltransferase-2
VTIDAFAPSWTAPILRRMPEISAVLDSPFAHGGLQLRQRWRIGRDLRPRGYDQAYVLPNSFKSALIPFFADIPLRVGYVGESRYGLINVVHRLKEKMLPLMAERYAQLAETPGKEVARPLLRSTLRVDEANLLITLARLGIDRSRPVVAFCPGAEFGPSKRWPARHFAELARRLAERGRAVWLIGSDKDQPIGAEIVELSGGAAINLCGRTNLASAVDLLSVAQLVVSNDSGLMHVAAALGRPLVALYGSSSAEHTPPLAREHQPIRLVKLEGLDCSPCFQRVCPLGHFRCMNDLDPARILAEVDDIRASVH